MNTRIIYRISMFILFVALIDCKGGKQIKGALNLRKNTKSLTKEEWDELRRGIKLMKMRSVKDRFDPMGYYFQANIHGWDKYDGTEKANQIADQMNWHRCQHGHYFFLVWHRMYLYHFEKILQKLTGNDSLTVPYWDYFDVEERSLPEPFRIPADAQKNPLYVKERCHALNEGMPFREEIVNPLPALNTQFFTVNNDINRYHFCHTFGGARIDGPKLISDRQGLLERIPHDMIHMFLGGPGGFMSDECKTARDPIFWLHHSTIDRIWESWKITGGVDDMEQSYLNQTFDFFNTKGEKRSYRVGDFLDAKKLGYKYDTLMTSGVRTKKVVNKIPEVRVSATQVDSNKLDVGPGHMSIVLDLEQGTEAIFQEMGKNPGNFDRIRFSLQVDFNYIDSDLIYNMHLNLPEDQYPYENRPYYISSLVYFQAKCVPLVKRELKSVKKCYDVTENIKAVIKRAYTYNGSFLKSINITFVPKSCDDIILSKDLEDYYEKSLIRFNEIHLIHYFINY